MREDFWEFTPTHKVWLATNHKPIIRGTDRGIWRRTKLIPFNVEIPELEQDPELPEKLRAELSGILNWAILGHSVRRSARLLSRDVFRHAQRAP